MKVVNFQWGNLWPPRKKKPEKKKLNKNLKEKKTKVKGDKNFKTPCTKTDRSIDLSNTEI